MKRKRLMERGLLGWAKLSPGFTSGSGLGVSRREGFDSVTTDGSTDSLFGCGV
jgi:hypothetical protein